MSSLKKESLLPVIIPIQMDRARAATFPKMSFRNIIKGIKSGDEIKEIASTYAACRILSRECHDSLKTTIDKLIKAKVVPKLVKFLSRASNPDLQCKAAWALTNIASGTSYQTKAVVNAGAVAEFISLLDSPHPFVVEQAVMALGNIAGDGPKLRDHLVDQGIIKPLLNLIKPDTSATILRTVTWTLSGLCYDTNPPPSVATVRQLLPALVHLIHNNNDEEILAEACSAISYLTYGPYIQEVVDAGIVSRFVTLLEGNEVAMGVISPALRTMRNISSESDSQTESLLNAGACPLLAKMLQHFSLDIIKEAAWTVSNIAAGNTVHIEALFTNNVIRPLVDVLSKGDFNCKKEVVWAITNISKGGNVEQITSLCKFGTIASLCSLLKAEEDEIVLVGLDGLANILGAAKRIAQLEKVTLLVEECGGLNRLEDFLIHHNVEIYHKSLAIVEQYFSMNDYSDEETYALSTSGNHERAS